MPLVWELMPDKLIPKKAVAKEFASPFLVPHPQSTLDVGSPQSTSDDIMCTINTCSKVHVLLKAYKVILCFQHCLNSGKPEELIEFPSDSI